MIGHILAECLNNSFTTPSPSPGKVDIGYLNRQQDPAHEIRIFLLLTDASSTD